MNMRERIRYTRVLYKLTQREVADGLGVSKQYITQIEGNKLVATTSKLEEILNMIYKLGEAKNEGKLKEILNDLKKQI